MTSYTIDYATEQDIPHILSLLHELALHDNRANLLTATPASLSATLHFGPLPTPERLGHGWAQCLLLRVPMSAQATASGTTTDAGIAHDYTDGESEVAGMVLWYTNFSAWRAIPGCYLEDIFLRSAYRGQGYGKALFGRLAREVRAMGGGGIEWICMSNNTSGLAFYKALGAVEVSGFVGMGLDANKVKILAGEGDK